MQEYDTLVISDIHLGSRICRPDKVLTVLKGSSFKTLIINGDLFDSEKTHKFNIKHWEIVTVIASLADKIPVFLVGGNHGRELDFIARKIGVTVIDNHAFTVADKKFLCLHGDEFDMFIKRLPITTHVFTQLFYLIQKLDGEKQYGAMVIKRLSKKILGISKRQQRLALKRGADQKANVVICSHTHIPHIGEQDGIQFINSGSFCDSKSTYVTIDNEGLVNLKEI